MIIYPPKYQLQQFIPPNYQNNDDVPPILKNDEITLTKIKTKRKILGVLSIGSPGILSVLCKT
jgi:hypothetical protein